MQSILTLDGLISLKDVDALRLLSMLARCLMFTPCCLNFSNYQQANNATCFIWRQYVNNRLRLAV
jgi:hypothetical protein